MGTSWHLALHKTLDYRQVARKAKFLRSTFTSSAFVDAMDMTVGDTPYHAFKSGVGARYTSSTKQL